MNSQHTTLRDVLTQAKPDIPYKRSPCKDTRNKGWPECKNSVTIWADFNLSTLEESYGRILDLPVPSHVQLPAAPNDVLAGVSIIQKWDIRHLICWNDQMVKPTLDFARRELGVEPGIGLKHLASTVDNSVLAKLHVSHPHTVDHVIMLDNLQPLVVGLGRTTQWSARKLMLQLPNPSNELLWPVRQLAQLCKMARTRYGYIQTGEELAVCCFSAENGPHDKEWKAAIQAIPWARQGSDALTTDLALWWLCMLAISGQHHRTITREEDVVSISAWDTIYLDEERGWVRRHQYSNIEVPTSPPSPPAYQTPTPGNVNAFEAQVGLNARHDFNIGENDTQHTFRASVNNNGVVSDFDSNFGSDFDSGFDFGFGLGSDFDADLGPGIDLNDVNFLEQYVADPD